MSGTCVNLNNRWKYIKYIIIIIGINNNNTSTQCWVINVLRVWASYIPIDGNKTLY